MTRLDRPLRRELQIRQRAYVVTLDQDGMKLTLKGHRKGQELKWDDFVTGDAAFAVALNASLAQANDVRDEPKAAPRGKRRSKSKSRPVRASK